MRLLKTRRFWLVFVAGLWLVTVYLRALYPEIAPWEFLWILWVLAHDLIAACFGYILGLANKAAHSATQRREYQQRVVDFADEVDVILKENGNGDHKPDSTL